MGTPGRVSKRLSSPRLISNTAEIMVASVGPYILNTRQSSRTEAKLRFNRSTVNFSAPKNRYFKVSSLWPLANKVLVLRRGDMQNSNIIFFHKGNTSPGFSVNSSETMYNSAPVVRVINISHTDQSK